MFGDQLIDGDPRDEPVQSGDHRGALAGGVVGRAVQRMAQEPLRALRLRDHLIQLGNLCPHGLTPLRARRIQDSGRGVQRQAQPLGDLDERETAELLESVHPSPCPPGSRSHESAFVVVAQGRRVQPQPVRRLPDRDEVHDAI